MEQFQDVELVSDGEIIPCHKLILALNSQYFRTLFMSNFQEEDSIEIMFFGPQTMKTIKKFIYTGELSGRQLDLQAIWHAADKYDVNGLKDAICSKMKNEQLRGEDVADMFVIRQIFIFHLYNISISKDEN